MLPKGILKNLEPLQNNDSKEFVQRLPNRISVKHKMPAGNRRWLFVQIDYCSQPRMGKCSILPDVNPSPLHIQKQQLLKMKHIFSPKIQCFLPSVKFIGSPSQCYSLFEMDSIHAEGQPVNRRNKNNKKLRNSRILNMKHVYSSSFMYLVCVLSLWEPNVC